MRFFSLAACLVACGILNAAPTYNGPVKAQEVRVRDGVGNFLEKLKANKTVTVAYLGGSITAMNGWRNMTTKWLQAANTNATVKEVHASIGGTGSDLGAFRVGHDALRHKPDLLFVEFATNDSGVPDEAILREDQATFTWENAICSRHVLEKMNMKVKTSIIVCQAFHARRCYLYYKEQFPETELLICPVVTKGISRDNWFLDEDKIDVVLGEVERCGSQFHRIIKEKITNPGPCDHVVI